MKTTQEKRMSLSCNKKYIRAKRNYKNLPDVWDDKPRTRRTRGWKNSKKLKQWSERESSFITIPYEIGLKRIKHYKRMQDGKWWIVRHDNNNQ
jgi:hypothetical protein